MDPNANLREQLTIAKFILADKELQNEGTIRLAELIVALDDWIAGGGFLPERWSAASDLHGALEALVATVECRFEGLEIVALVPQDLRADVERARAVLAKRRRTPVAAVTCCLCHQEAPALTAHLHQGQWIGDECCWDERLRSSE